MANESPVHKLRLISSKIEVLQERYGVIPDILVRKCYDDLYNLIVNNISSKDFDYSTHLITGVPGIGKSLFMLYFLCRLIHEKGTLAKFALEFDRGIYHVFERTAHGSNQFWYYIENSSLNLSDTLLLCDISDVKEPYKLAKWRMIFSSPNNARYKQSMKISPHVTFCMPTWSEAELEYLEPDRSWYDLFALLGGVPRHVIWNGRGDDPRDLLEAVITDKGAEIVNKFFSHGHGGIDMVKSHMIVHINPQSETVYSRYNYSFASDQIFQRLCAMFNQSLIANACNLFNSGVSSDTFGGASAGNLFEKVCLWLVPLNGKSIEATSLESGRPLNFTFPHDISVLTSDWRSAKSQEMNQDVLYQPKFANLESGDAFCVIADPEAQEKLMLIVVQITVAEHHSVKVNGLHTIWNSYSNDIQQRIHRKALLFVTPSEGKLCTKQYLVTQSEQIHRKIPPIFSDLEQFRYRYTLDSKESNRKRKFSRLG
jgi:hypothetical protein